MKQVALITPLLIDRLDVSYGLHKIKEFALKDKEIKDKIEISIVGLTDYENLEERFTKLIESGVNMIGLSMFIWNVTQNLKCAHIIKKIDPSVLVVLGGPQVSDIKNWNIFQYSNAVDVVIQGEGEEVFSNVLKHWLKNDTVNNMDFRGVAYHQKEIGGVVNHGKARVTVLDAIPSIYRQQKVNPDIFYGLETNRGCYNRCAYCCIGASKFRQHSLDYVTRELERMADLGINKIIILDSSFTYNLKRTKKIAALLQKNRMRYICCAYAEELSEEMIDILIDSGALKLEFGLQSSNNEALRLMNRKMNQDCYRENMELLMQKVKGTDIEVNVDIICGLPGDNLETFKKSLDFAYSFYPTKVSAFPLQLLPGTEFFAHQSNYGFSIDPIKITPNFDLNTQNRYNLHKYNLVKSNLSFSEDDMNEGVKIAKLNSLIAQTGLNETIYAILDNENIPFLTFFDHFYDIIDDHLYSLMECYDRDIKRRTEIMKLFGKGLLAFMSQHCETEKVTVEIFNDLAQKFQLNPAELDLKWKNQSGGTKLGFYQNDDKAIPIKNKTQNLECH